MLLKDSARDRVVGLPTRHSSSLLWEEAINIKMWLLNKKVAMKLDPTLIVSTLLNMAKCHKRSSIAGLTKAR